VDKNNNPVRNSISGTNTNNSTNFNSNNVNTNKTANNLQQQVARKMTTPNLNNNLNLNQIPSTNTSNSKSTNSYNNFNNNINKENANTNLGNHLFNLLNNNKASKNISEVTNNLSNNNNQNRFPNSYIEAEQKINFNSNSFAQQTNIPIGSSVNNFLANYNSFNKRNSNTSQYSILSKSPSTNEINEEELQKLSERHEKLINKILIEEESYIENHKKHVDSLVEIIREVRKLLTDIRN